jgi:hypothetical protein
LCLDQAISATLLPSWQINHAYLVRQLRKAVSKIGLPGFSGFRVSSSSADHYIGPLKIIYRFLEKLTVLVSEFFDINNSQRDQVKMIDERPKLEQANMANSNIHNAI